MLNLLVSLPRVLIGALLGMLVGFFGAFALHNLFPAVSLMLSAGLVAVVLAAGVVVGALWEARQS